MHKCLSVCQLQLDALPKQIHLHCPGIEFKAVMPRRQLALSAAIFCFVLFSQLGGAAGIWEVKTRDAAKHPTVCKTANYPVRTVPVLKLKS